ncbi:MAG: SusD/RagB family nutrient-binding outer membrane lipoprotein [Sphingobacteriales bacterium]|nr:SusD/RagB family nutrient-binding outer membrane lipoprotein [Sphingobacteriales bacterium]OJV97370.1 MAG: hypothetical protein BGO52_08730 [Sphingobacteriales bacterium 44-61]
MKSGRIIYIACLITLLGVAACSKNKFDINSNPDDVTDGSVTATVLLPAAQQETSRLLVADFWVLNWWMGYGARSGSYQTRNEEETYQFTNNFKMEIWNDLYRNATNYNLVINRANEAGEGFFEAVGRIMKSHNFQLLVDIYGNIPYTEAFRGTAASTPKYDTGIDIYKSIFAELDKAIGILQDNDAISQARNPEMRTADLVFRGNATNWIRFANTLRLRMLVHLLNGTTTTTTAPGIDINEQIAKITTDGFLNEGQSAHLNPGFSGTKPNPYYRYYHTNESGTGAQNDFLRGSEYAISYYDANGDPRLDRFYVAPASGHRGIRFGTPSGDPTLEGNFLSTIRGVGLIPEGAASRAWIMTSVESLFLQAEARERGILTTGPSAEELLTRAVTESFVWLGLTQADADEYLLFNEGYPDVDYHAPSIRPGQPGGGIYTILSQKWFALNSIAPYEIWTDYRRTGITYGTAVGYVSGPTLSVDPNRTATSIPVRLFYPQSEYNYNAANVNAEGTINVFNNRIFWDLN